MNLTDIPSALTGDTLLEAIKGAKGQRKPIAEGLLYEKTILMIAAEPGSGKSTISTQVAIELAAGLPVFGCFFVSRPVKVFYILSERDIVELLERIEIISKTLPIVKENIVATAEYQSLNLLNPSHSALFFKCIKRDCPNPNIIFIDPIYSTVSGGLSKDEPASIFTKTMNLLQKEFSCILWYNHHTVKPQHNREGFKIEKDDPFYGSQWLKAHVTGSYLMKKTDSGVTLTCKKDNYDILTSKIALEYDAETELSWSIDRNRLPAFDRIKQFLRGKKIAGETFTFDNLRDATLLSTCYLRRALVDTRLSGYLKSEKGSKNKKIYRVEGDDF